MNVNEKRELFYPTSSQVDSWVEGIWDEACRTEYAVELIDRNDHGVINNPHIKEQKFVRFDVKGMEPYYCYWQPAQGGAAPLLVHTPAYGESIKEFPDLVVQGYSVIDISPFGYFTPEGFDESKKINDNWPVYPDTIKSRGEKGYRQWLIQCVIAARWAEMQEKVLPGRISFFGSSQGGGISLLLGSIFRGRGSRCVAADVPFMINMADRQSANVTFFGDELLKDDELYGAGLIDIISHIHRLNLPVMLTAGEKDESCPAPYICSLFDGLYSTKLYCFLENQTHNYTAPFMFLAAAWFRLYA